MPPRASTSSSAVVRDHSDDDFVIPDDADDDSGDDFMDSPPPAHHASRNFAGTRGAKIASRGTKGSSATDGAGAARKMALPANKGLKDSSRSYAWEQTFQRTWDVVNEDESGSLEASVKHLLAAGKRRKAAKEEKRVRRGIIRHLVLVLDDSDNMNEKDGGRGTRLDILLPIARRFVNQYFEQNPIGQLAILLMRDGIADRLVPMGGNTSDHLAALSNKRRLEPRGDPSLQNALEMAKSTLAHLPTTSSREILLLSGSLTSCDPGNIHQTIASLKAARIRVDLIHITAEMKIMRDIARETGGTFGVALDDHHLEELIREGVAPREIIKKEEPAPRLRRGSGDESDDDEAGAELLQMGFPLRLPTHAPPSLCACHSRLFPPSTSSSSATSAGGNRSTKHSGAGNGFLCPRCNAKICDVPTDCPICGLTVVMSTHLARSYRHLFPVKTFRSVSWEALSSLANPKSSCTGCDEAFPPLPTHFPRATTSSTNGHDHSSSDARTPAPTLPPATPALTAPQPPAEGGTAGLAPSGRYECPKCNHHFCLECDSYVHAELFVCPGCG